MATLGLSPGRGAVSDLKAPGLKPERRQAQLGGIVAHRGRWLGRRRAMVARPSTVNLAEPEMSGAPELCGDPVIRTNCRAASMTAGSRYE